MPYYASICPTGSKIYYVNNGDTFHSIARQFHTTDAVLRQLNPHVFPNLLYVGQPICVPRVIKPIYPPPTPPPLIPQRGSFQMPGGNLIPVAWQQPIPIFPPACLLCYYRRIWAGMYPTNAGRYPHSQ